MKVILALITAALLWVPLAANAQDYPKLERSADAVKNAAESVSRSARDRFRRNAENSSDTIEQAFLAEQALAAAAYMKKLVDDKYGIGDLRLAAYVLTELSADFPAGGDWGRLKDSIGSLVFELGRGAGPPDKVETDRPVETPVEPPVENVDEDRILGLFFWNGEVDDEVRLTVRGTVITSETISGRRLEDGKYSFTSALPRESGLLVGVRMTEGRGEASVIQQPNPANDYSAVIRIRDGEGGARPYSLEIYWYKGN